MDGAMCLNDLGILLGPDLYEREVQYLVTNEWARTAEDILWRRTKLGLNIDKAGAVQLQRWLDLNIPELGLIRPQ
jgi:glycerol-3-phosphate dehydrogenase